MERNVPLLRPPENRSSAIKQGWRMSEVDKQITTSRNDK